MPGKLSNRNHRKFVSIEWNFKKVEFCAIPSWVDGAETATAASVTYNDTLITTNNPKITLFIVPNQMYKYQEEVKVEAPFTSNAGLSLRFRDEKRLRFIFLFR